MLVLENRTSEPLRNTQKKLKKPPELNDFLYEQPRTTFSGDCGPVAASKCGAKIAAPNDFQQESESIVQRGHSFIKQTRARFRCSMSTIKPAKMNF